MRAPQRVFGSRNFGALGHIRWATKVIAHMSDWRDITFRPTDEGGAPFLVLRPGNDVAAFVIEQVSVFEGQMYPDAANGLIDWDDRITDATHWKPTGMVPRVEVIEHHPKEPQSGQDS